MGYRSDVAIVVEGPATDINALLVEIRLTHPKSGEYLHLFTKTNVYSDFRQKMFTRLVFKDTDVKWYPDYEDVKFLNWVFERFAEVANDNDDISGSFVRIGEDQDDTEQNSFGNDSLCWVSRRIEFDFAEPKPIENGVRNLRKPDFRTPAQMRRMPRVRVRAIERARQRQSARKASLP